MRVHLWEVEALGREEQEGKDSQPFSVINKTRKVNWLHPRPLRASLDFGNQKVHEEHPLPLEHSIHLYYLIP